MIERHLRNGVMTEVYRARREGSGRDRFEVRRFTLVASSEALRAVRRELDRIQALRMPAIPALVDVIDDPVGLLVVTETVAEGATSLRMTLDAAGPLEVADCTRIVRVVAGVLDVLHGATPQVLHRRLSPDTITLIGPQREVRVEECGLAQALVDAGLVNARVPLQARQYLSPDELLQRPSPRGDLFALASVAFECLTGRPAFLGATEASLSAAILRGVRPSVSA
ncbi:MAG: protein kinase, partial [Deltaproteobacteria bacterium]|nr:protein kinase [Deltaproteobacteria bacterium]